MAHPWTLTFDCADPPRLAAFWKVALGYIDAPPPEGFDTWEQWRTRFHVPEAERSHGAALTDPDGVGPRISFLKVPEAKVAKNRLHVDVQVAGGRHQPWDIRERRIRDTVEVLVAAGGSVLTEHEFEGQLDHVVMADPEGNEFCVV
ncbi:MAG TPA: VOC family protein [Actinomycetales bacterium]|nr:VOC family protein [Actinomycetales bacterium]